MVDRQQAVSTRNANLLGALILTGNIQVKTGLHIGGASSTLNIGGVDNVVIRDALTGQPYIPGSSLRGKMRSLSEKLTNRRQNQNISRIGGGVWIHACETATEYAECEVCPIFGVPGEREAAGPTRLKVRDVFLTSDSVQEMSRLRTELPFTEIKWEATIDRVTSAAVPRQMERVPAGAVFGPFQLVYSIHEIGDVARFAHVVRALELVEDDYLGGQGSRGSGQVAFTDIELRVKTRADYGPTRETREPDLRMESLEGLQGRLAELNLADRFGAGGQ